MEEGKGSRYSSSKEIRSVLVRHWKSLDRARLHTFHLWLLIYSLAEIFILQYLCPNSQSVPCLVLSSLFILYLILSFIPIRYGDHNKRFSSVVISLISTVVFPVFLWIIHIPTLTQVSEGVETLGNEIGEGEHWNGLAYIFGPLTWFLASSHFKFQLSNLIAVNTLWKRARD
uniref:Transmembrane protein n=1 Tax=Steinernema glaseri TaxID=37863 RepID=A0A1I7Y3V1_9BILA